MKLPFTKMEGTGNDFVMLNLLEKSLDNLPELARKLSNRRFGIGADQILLVQRSDQKDFRMDIYNADGGKVEMCGNGIRCFAKYLLDKKLTTKTELSVETMGGIIHSQVLSDHPRNTKKTSWVKVDMGEPILEGREIPVNRDGLVLNQAFNLQNSSRENDERFSITCVSMGNPHCVICVDNVDVYPVEKYGPLVENDPFFPNRVNVEFVQLVDRKNIKMRAWERGAGETLACGTGACASVVASVLNNLTDREVIVHLKGGELEIMWDEVENKVFKTGPATTVFEGEIEI